MGGGEIVGEQEQEKACQLKVTTEVQARDGGRVDFDHCRITDEKRLDTEGKANRIY